MRKLRISTLFVIALLTILALEAMIRITGFESRGLNPTYIKVSSGYSELDDLISEIREFPPAPAYYDEFIYAMSPISTKHFTFTDFYSARWTPDSAPLHEADYIVWTFGGSTMENTETTDRLTIANTWANIFNEELGPTHIRNFGTGGFFSSFQLIKFQRLLREVPEGELPAISIFYDGYNDAYFGFQYGPGKMQTDLSLKLRALVEHKDLMMWVYVSSRMLSKHSKLWEQTGARLLERLFFPLAEPDTRDEILDATTRVYASNLRMIQGICDIYQIQCFFVLQPLIVTKQPLTPLEQTVLREHENHPAFRPEGTQFIRSFYDLVKREFANNWNFIDASHILDGRSESDFYDLGHTGALTSPVIGERIADMILARIAREETHFAD